MLNLGCVVSASLIQRDKAASWMEVRLPFLNELRRVLRIEVVSGNCEFVSGGVVHESRVVISLSSRFASVLVEVNLRLNKRGLDVVQQGQDD